MRVGICIAALALLIVGNNSQLSAAVVSFSAEFNHDESELKLGWSNTSSEVVLINLGHLTGSHLLLGNSTSMYISGTGLPSGNLINTREPAGIAGRVEPYIICLPPGSEYNVRLETRYLMLPGYKQTVADLRGRPFTIFISFKGQPASRFGPAGKLIPYDSVMQFGQRIPFWTATGKVSINR